MLPHVISAFRLLTRIPMPTNHVEWDAQSVRWFPLVGMVIGGILAAISLLPSPPLVNALLITLGWIAITGGLHLDGAADLADGLGAAHCDRNRLLSVMKDPHIGSFGVIILIAIMLTKVIALQALLTMNDLSQLWALLLIPAWARLGAAYWIYTVQPLAPSGMGASHKEAITLHAIILWTILLAVVGSTLLPTLFTVSSLLFIGGWQWFLRRYVGGMNGDCLGAGVEWCECAMLLLLATRFAG